MRALIVDDDRFVRSGLRRTIDWNTLGFSEVLEAYNGVAALRIIRQKNPELVITDILMPVMDGIELCQKIREEKSKCAIIMLSAYNDFEYARSAMQYQVSDYFLKPLTDETLSALHERINQVRQRIMMDYSHLHSLYHLQTHVKNLEGVIKSRQAGDLEPVLTALFTDLDAMDPHICRDISAYVVGFLQHTLQEMGCETKLTEEKRQQLIRGMLTCQTNRQVFQYTLQVCKETLEALSPPANSILWTEKIKVYVRQHYADSNLNIKSLSQVFHLVAPYVGSLFKEAEGISLNEYINQYRMEVACELLMNPVIHIYEVGSQVGIPDPNYFTKCFRKFKGLSPKEYRTHQLRGDDSAPAPWLESDASGS